MLIDSNMKNSNKPIIVYTFLFFSLILNWKSITSQEVEDQKEFDYLKDSEKGPERWGDHEGWEDCKKGNMQSPIDLMHERVEVVPELGQLQKNYKPANATIKNRGHDITIHFVIGTAGSIQINGIPYDLDQCHWHSPSEHTINGKRFALELHMVHRNLKLNKTAVIGALYRTGEGDTFLNEIENDIKHITDSSKEVNIGVVDPRHIKTRGKRYYRYLGSLTTPPCTEGVIWTINKRLRSVSDKQIMLLREAVRDNSEKNARPLQPLNDREIYLYSPKHYHHHELHQ